MWMRGLVTGPSRAESFSDGVRTLAALFLTMLVVATRAAGGGTNVTITGGADASGHRYSWTVTNDHISPIVRVEFPHYHAGLFFAPPGWSTDESTFLVNVGVKDRVGVCIASVTSPMDAIMPGDSAAFGMQIAAAGAQRRPGEVLLSFADGSKAVVSGVELPHRAGVGERYMPLIGLGTIFAIMVIIRLYRARRRPGDFPSAAKLPRGEG